jgi:hypothetical protein
MASEICEQGDKDVGWEVGDVVVDGSAGSVTSGPQRLSWKQNAEDKPSYD